MLSLHQLRCFLATYEHGSLTGAAEELGYAQPSVSEQVRLLERSGLYVGARNGSVWASPDGGETWTEAAGNLPDVMVVRAAAI